ncbi:MAG TPA: acetyl-CoA C-acetyltransferase [Candidatus Thermoplasmatota archaeon]|nr:acetyl-CoA C-acetyltransferase [Candidatus Thermoplasmatota archaeon]
MRDVVIAAAVRTPIGKFNGSLKNFKAPDLGALVMREALARAHVRPEQVDEVIMGNVLQAGVGQNPARQAALKAGLPVTVAAQTVNKVCGSSLKAVMLAAQAIKAGDLEIAVAGGQESMTNAPYLLPNARDGYRLGNGQLIDSLIHDGLQDAYDGSHMGLTGEIVAEEWSISRKEADDFAADSHRKAAAAQASGRFKDEILPIQVPVGKGKTELFAHDEGVRNDTTPDTLAKLRAVFKEDGLVTAGNASQISDGASAVVVASREAAERLGLPILATVRAYGTAGVEPKRVMSAPIPGVQALLQKANLTVKDVDLFEHNEAFASASCAVKNALHIPVEKFNVNGGAVALGHPIGASGARVLTTLIYELRRRGGQRGVATLCLGGGNAVSMLVETA